MISTAVGSELVSRIVGYQLNKGNFSETSPNLPQRVAILGEANTANQGSLDLSPKEILSSQEAGETYGFGSPIHIMMRILRSVNGGNIGGIPTIVYPQAEGAATAAVREVTPTGTATANGTHTLVINGRTAIDGSRYDFVVVDGDTPAVIIGKMNDAVNAVLGSPVIATGVTESVLTTKWAGLTSEDIDVVVDTNGNGLGVTYAVVSTATGAGTPPVTTALNLFGSNWNTIVVNPYSVSTVLDELEAFNGIPDPTTPTGRYTGIVMKPFVALFGDTSVDPSTVTDARLAEVTNAACPAPNSKGFPMEAAANMTLLFARVMQDKPNLDVNPGSYVDMPIPSDGVIGGMSDYLTRDAIVKKGSSTVDLVASKYQIQDFVTTYHPVGEVPPAYRYARNLMLDFNVRYGYLLLELINVVDKTIANDNDVITITDFIKPKQWKQIIGDYAEDLARRGLIADPAFMQDSLLVGISGTNPDRLETFFRYKRTGIARISSTTAEAGFNFGSV